MGGLSLLQGIFPIQGSNPGFLHCRRILYQLSHQGSQDYWSGWPIPSPGDLPNPEIEPGSPSLQVDSLPAEYLGSPDTCMCCAWSLSCIRLFGTHGLGPTRVLCPCGFSRQEYWSGLSCPPPEDLPNPGIEPRSPTLQADALPSVPPGKP